MEFEVNDNKVNLNQISIALPKNSWILLKQQNNCFESKY